MKKIFGLLLFLLASHFAFAQKTSEIEQQLNTVFQKISPENKGTTEDYDSLSAANLKFEKLLLKYTGSNSETLHYDFKVLKKNGLIMTTSEDGKFRIYSWDTWTGGTMHYFRNVFQYESNKKVYSEATEIETEGDAQSFYYQMNDILSQNKKYYLAQNKAILSSGLSYHNIKVFSIDDGKLNHNAKLIKTQSGIKNQLGYEVDLTASSNRDNEISNYNIEYDPKNKIISIPLILENYKITDKKIRYQFKGKYFEKM
ncbi:hypothetical protein [Chryseobacterium herbae]|uniref:DUF4292 domain-containing protein n=1 Tax=Chryseobacterium herbae TaxID=2976476 RepID=A0ABT2IUK1_9FLAO|nr:hypothetical protein [Chryseobacterium sp. pc1-10]MCT2562506.1 hypothetical protein [Chryseobacterium sp. pc1-10]